MLLFNHVRNLINDLLAPTGFAFERTAKFPWKWFKPVATAQIGNYVIKVPSKNPVAWHYSCHPDLISQLGRLTSILKGKYPGLAAIDVGANVGDTACIIKSAADIPLVCVEGDAFTFGFLRQNVVQFRNTTAHQLFLGETTSTVSVNMENAGWNLTLKPGTNPSASAITLTSLDDFLANRPDRTSFHLLKIDTEGFDCSILRGSLKYIAEVSPVITFEYNRGNMDAIGEPGLPTLFKLQEMGYNRIVFHDQNGRYLLSTTLADCVMIKDLHQYADCKQGRIGYLDITVFHAKDTDLADAFIEQERVRQSK